MSHPRNYTKILTKDDIFLLYYIITYLEFRSEDVMFVALRR